MAILSIKNFPDDLYHKLRAPAKRQHRSVTQEVIQLLSELLENPKPLSVLDLKGLGKEHWKGIDPAKRVARERASWGLMADLGRGPVGRGHGHLQLLP